MRTRASEGQLGLLDEALGVIDPELENFESSAGPLVMTHGAGFGDYLGVASGGVQLTRSGELLDALYWGSTPNGSPFVNTSFAGGAPISEGDSLGRNSASTFTGAAADWAISGGANANGPTPGVANIVEFPSPGDFVLYQDSALNSIVAGLSRSEQFSGWLQVTGASPSIASISSTANTMTVGVDHVLDVTVHGAPVRLSGRVTTTFNRTTAALATSEAWNTSGQIAATGSPYALTLSVQRSSSGAHALLQAVNSTTSYTWKHNGVSRNVAVSAARTSTRVSATVWNGAENRIGADWGSSDAKTGSVTWTKTKLGDGAYRLASTTKRSMPTLLAHPSHSSSPSNGVLETIDETQEIAIDGRDLTLAGMGATTTTDGKETHVGSLSLSGRAGPATTLSFAIDPPLQNPTEERSVGGKACDFVVTTATCVGGGVAGQIVANGAGGAKAIGQMVGKGAATKLIPFVGWFCTAVCVVKAVGDLL